jgi:hypothetical protein
MLLVGRRVSAGLPGFSCGVVSGLVADGQVMVFSGGL